MSEVIENQGWCVEHYCYFVEAEGCDTCNYEAELEEANNENL